MVSLLVYQHHRRQYHQSLYYQQPTTGLLQNVATLTSRQPAQSSTLPTCHLPSWTVSGALLQGLATNGFPGEQQFPHSIPRTFLLQKMRDKHFQDLFTTTLERGRESTHARTIVSIGELRNTEKDISLLVTMPIIWHSNTTSAIQLFVSHGRWVKTLISFVEREKKVENPSHKDPLWLRIQGKQY